MELLDLVSKQYPALLAIVTAVSTVFASGLVTTILTQITKLPFVPIAAKRYPKVTSIGFAVITAALSVWLLNVAIVVDWVTFVFFVAVTVGVSWKVYDASYAIVQEIVAPKAQ